MPHWFEAKGNLIPRSKDRRVKLTEKQREEIRSLYGTISQRKLAAQFGVSRRTVQFIGDPSKHEENLKRREERGGSAAYYDKDKNRKYIREHRQYKKKTLEEKPMYPIKLSKTKTVKYEDQVEYAVKGKVIAVSIKRLQDDIEADSNTFFTTMDIVKKKQRGKNPTVATFMSIENDDCFNLCDPEKFKVVEEAFGAGRDFYPALEKSIIQGNAIDLMASDEYNVKNLIRFKSYDHTFYKVGNDHQFSMPYRVGYIGGVCNDCYDLNKAEKLLNKCKYVYDVERIEIPYYNADAGRNFAIEFTVKLPQKKHDELLDLFAAIKSGRGYRIKDILAGFYMFEDCPDILGLSDALLSKEERERRKEMY